MLKINEIYHGDCLEIMKEIDDKSIDMILCDLPYGTTKCKWDTIIPFDELWKYYKRIIKDNGAIVLTATQPFTSALIMSNIEYFKYCWIWDKIKPNGHLVAKFRPMQRSEDIVIFSKNKINYYPQMTQRDKIKQSKEYSRTTIMGGAQTNYNSKYLKEKYPQSILQFSNASQKNKLHPTQKPLELGEYLIKTYTKENNLILDNCCGSGSFLLSAKNINRNFIGIELDEKYYKISKQRLSK